MVSETISHYRIIKKLGAGGMGEVHLADDIKLRRKVALKLLSSDVTQNPDLLRRFEQEAQAASALNHPNILTIYEFGEENGAHFIATEFVDGETLRKRIARSQMSIREVLDVSVQTASALAAAHAAGIIHRDIKPENIMLRSDGYVKVLDFGLAKLMQQEKAATTETEVPTMVNTAPGLVLGTVSYMSPEQASGLMDVDGRSDIWSLGVVIYEMLARRVPFGFEGATPTQVISLIIQRQAPPVSQVAPVVPEELSGIVMKALENKKEDRYQTAEDMLGDLRRLSKQLERDSEDGLTVTLDSGGGGTSPQRSVPTQSAASQHSSARMMISDVIRRPRLSLGSSILAIAVTGLIVWGALHFWRPALHQPTAEARFWYEKGEHALRDGTYYQASKALERAVELDDKFALAHARLADAYAEIDYTDKAKDELLAASSLVPDRSALPKIDAIYLDAIAATVRREFPAAIEHYRTIAEQATDSEKPNAYVDLGRAYEKNENIEKAIASYLEASKRDQQSATSLLRLAILYGRQQNLKEATEAFNKAEAIYQASSNLEGVTEVVYQRGVLLNKIDKLAEARVQLDRALEIARTTANKYQEIKTLLQLSSVSYSGGDTARAKEQATEAIGLAQANNIEDLATNGLIELGITFFLRGEQADAEKYFKQALDFAQRRKARRSEARALMMLGSLNQQRRNADETIRYAEQALAFYQPGGYRKETSQGLILLGRANQQKGDYAAALQIFEQQLQVANELGDPSQVASSQLSIGLLLMEQQQYPAALPHLDESYKIDESLGAKQRIGFDLLNRGTLLWLLGRYQEARTALDKAFSIADRPESGYKRLLAGVYLSNAQMALSERRFPEAKAKAQQASEVAGTQFEELALQARYTIGLADGLSGAPQAGRPLCEQVVAMAKEKSNPGLLANALLALAEVMLKAGDAQNASTTALQAQVMFARSGRQDSEWHAWLIAAGASRLAGNEPAMHDYASRAAGLLSELQQKWGPEVYGSYLSRPDIQSCRQQIDQILAKSK
jgi:serine/threonine protein kinase/Tfp pilus assembly protein PilF